MIDITEKLRQNASLLRQADPHSFYAAADVRAANEIDALRSRLRAKDATNLPDGYRCACLFPLDLDAPDGPIIGMECDYHKELRSRLADIQRLYRGQVANDGSYPDHLFTPAELSRDSWRREAEMNQEAADKAGDYAARLAELVTLLLEIREDAVHFGMPTTRIDAFLTPPPEVKP